MSFKLSHKTADGQTYAHWEIGTITKNFKTGTLVVGMCLYKSAATASAGKSCRDVQVKLEGSDLPTSLNVKAIEAAIRKLTKSGDIDFTKAVDA